MLVPLNTQPIATEPQVLNHVADQVIFPDELFNLKLNADLFVDPEADSFTLSAAQLDHTPLPNWLNFDPIEASFTGIPTKDNVGMIRMKVTATDTRGAANRDVFNLQIKPRSQISPLYLSLPAILNSSK